MHATRSAKAGFKARAVTETAHSSHPTGVASANVRGSLATDRRGALAAGCLDAFTVNGTGVLRMHRCLA
jgi:hypothetical protein